MKIDLLSSLSGNFPSDFSLFKKQNNEGLGSEIIDLIFLGAAGLVSMILVFSIAGSTGLINVLTKGSSWIFWGTGAVLAGLGAIYIIKKEPTQKGKWWGAVFGIALLFILIGVSFGAVESYTIFEQGTNCKSVFKEDATNFESYVTQLECMVQNPKAMMIGVIILFIMGTVLWAMLPSNVQLISWPFAAVLTLFLMRRPIIMKTFGVFVEAVFGQIFLVMLLLGIISGYVFYKKHEKQKLEDRINDLKARER